jgi:diguanylate cyclase (GGDEF)-like protein/PAS domain S-box-containing protein
MATILLVDEIVANLDVQLDSERDPNELLTAVCGRARELVGAKYAVLAAIQPTADRPRFFTTSGIHETDTIACPEIGTGPLRRVMGERATVRLTGLNGDPRAAGLPPGYPPLSAVLAAPIASLRTVYGWICLADKVGGVEFTDEDERALTVLGAQVGRIYENGSLYLQVKHQADHLVREMQEREHVVAELRESEERFRQLAENIQDVFYITSGDGDVMLYLSPAYEHVWGRRRSAVHDNANLWVETIHPADRQNAVDQLQLNRGSKTRWEMEYRIVRPDGTVRWILARTFPIVGDDGNPVRVVGVATDITERKQAHAKIEHLNRVHAMLSGINALIVRVRDRDELFKEACRLAVDHGRFKMAWIGMLDAGAGEVGTVAHAGEHGDFLRAIRVSAAPTPGRETLVSVAMRSQRAEVRNDIETDVEPMRHRDELLAHGCRAIAVLPLVVEARSVGCFVLATDEAGIFVDAELRLLNDLAGDVSFALGHIEKTDRLDYLAYYDALTGLANRNFFSERLSQYLDAANRAGTRLALVVAQTMRFETIGDAFGRQVGDVLFRQIAERFARSVGNSNEVGRVGPHHLAAVILDVREEGEVAHRVGEWWRKWLGETFRVGGNDLELSARSGIALFPSDGTDASTLLKSAEAALRKTTATDETHRFYTQHLSERIAEKFALESKLRRALTNEEFVLHYQAKIVIETRHVAGVEALIRWQSPELGLVPPNKFISLMEDTGMIVEVGAWALRQAMLDRTRWSERGVRAPRVAVNVSAVQIRRHDFVESIAEILRLGGVDPGIDIEITESLVMADIAANIEKLKAIRNLGVGIAIDDFGTGYSSLSYLAKLPVTVLKIDRSFTAAMLDDPGLMSLVSTMITLAHSLELAVVAEGVETEEQAKILRLLRCDQMQGYLISKPIAFEEMTTHLLETQALGCRR